jgi:ABC-2 type transport system ATP-binding protein
MTAVIEIDHLSVTYRSGFRRRRVEAVRDISFSVAAGEIFGFLGPNGAGKTTSIRVLMGLIRATGGTCRILGNRIPSRNSRARLGFLPESPYFYDYLTVAELIDLSGRLFGMSRRTLRKRADELIELVGLQHARDVPLRKYSKGMLQRAGIAQSLVNDPELVVFDEPMSGLDPLGRKEVRDIILALRDQGKTVFFSTHILPDAELICDRVAIIVAGVLRSVGALSELIDRNVRAVEIAFRVADAFGPNELAEIEQRVQSARRVEDQLAVTVGGDADVDELLALAHRLGARVQAVTPHHQTLEDVFLRSAEKHS